MKFQNDRDSYDEIHEFVEGMYDEHAAHPELYYFVDFDGETNRIINEMSITDELVECLLYIALAISAIRRGKSIPKSVKTKVCEIIMDNMIQAYNNELSSTEKEAIKIDLSEICKFIENTA